MDSILKQEHINVQPSACELLIFPELQEFHSEESTVIKKSKLNNNLQEILENLSEINTDVEESISNSKQLFLYYFFSRFFYNLSLLANHKQVLVKIDLNIDFLIYTLSSESIEFLNPVDLNKYFLNLVKFETSLIKLRRTLSLRFLTNQSKNSYKNCFHTLNLNFKTKLLVTKSDWFNGDLFRKITKYARFKKTSYKAKLDTILKDKLLLKHLIQSFYFTTPKKVKKKNLKRIYKIVLKNRLFKLIGRIIKKLVLRRKLLWLNIQINIVRFAKFFLIGKDYKIYRKRLAYSFRSQTNKYIVNISKKRRLNTKFIKCVEYLFDRKLMQKIKGVLNKIAKINLHLRYFLNRFPSKLVKYKIKLSDKHFVIPVNSKILSFDESLEHFSKGTLKHKNKILDTILFLYKHKLEKRLLLNILKKRERPLERYLKILENEKYYQKHRKTRFPKRVRRWLMKYVNESLNNEFCEYFSRPRVIFEKKETETESTYPYLPRIPLKFRRDSNAQSFRRKKRTKYRIIRLTKPLVVLQPHFFKYKGRGINLLSKNVLRTKLGSKLAVPERIQRIRRACQKFYTNFLKDNSYTSFMNLIIKLKTLFLLKPELKNNPKYLIIYLLSSIISPVFSGISEERDYADQLNIFLSNYLIRMRLYKRYDSTKLVVCLKTGYIIPKPIKFKKLKYIYNKTRSVVKKRPNYTALKFMKKRSLKRLTRRIRSKIAVARGLGSLFKHHLIATKLCSPMNLKKNFKTKGYHYLFQPDIDKKAKAKYKYYFSALKRTFGYATAFHTNARLSYFSPYYNFYKNPVELNLEEVETTENFVETTNNFSIKNI